MTGGDWFSKLEQQLEEQLEAFLRDNPDQEQLLQAQEQRERQRRLRQRRLELRAAAERLRGELLQLAGEISQWQERVQRARRAAANDLALRAEAHVATLMARGRDRWQVLGQLGVSYREVEAELARCPADSRSSPAAGSSGAGDSGTGESGDDLDQAWSAFEAEQALEELRRRQSQG